MFQRQIAAAGHLPLGLKASVLRRKIASTIFKFANRKPDHDRLVAFLKNLPGDATVGLEATGDYHRPLAYRLLSEGIAVVSISSLALACVREARFGTWDKNDPKDAQIILSMLTQNIVQTIMIRYALSHTIGKNCSIPISDHFGSHPVVAQVDVIPRAAILS